MKLQAIIDAFWIWMDVVAATVIAAVGKLRRPLLLRLIEVERDCFRLESQATAKNVPANQCLRVIEGRFSSLPNDIAAAFRSSRAELILQPDRFLFRPFELPTRAAEFLDGIIRAQIDRLTPWSANDAVFGWTPPGNAVNDRISLTVCAAPKIAVSPYVAALADLGVQSTVVSTRPEGSTDGVPIKVMEHQGKGGLDRGRVRRVLAATLVLTGLSAGIASVIDQFVSADLDDRKVDITRQISQWRATMLRDGSVGPPSALRSLERRKRETPSSVIVIETLSRILPDHTYVTELRVEGDKLQIIGITHDAPALIPLIEQSRSFTRATFFAPTTRSAGDPGERFHIEAQIKPLFGSGS
jgi:general secretion pathway protein L